MPRRRATVLDALERFRDELEGLFDHAGDVAVVIHPRPPSSASPSPGSRSPGGSAAPASRRYFAGWFGAARSTCWPPPALERRASRVRRLARGAAAHPASTSTRTWWSARTTRPCRRPSPSRPSAATSRMAWLCEGAATCSRGPDAAPARGDSPPAARGRAAGVSARAPGRAAAGRHGVRAAGARARRRACVELALARSPLDQAARSVLAERLRAVQRQRASSVTGALRSTH